MLNEEAISRVVKRSLNKNMSLENSILMENLKPKTLVVYCDIKGNSHLAVVQKVMAKRVRIKLKGSGKVYSTEPANLILAGGKIDSIPSKYIH